MAVVEAAEDAVGGVCI
jgi:hypothetical protein